MVNFFKVNINMRYFFENLSFYGLYFLINHYPINEVYLWINYVHLWKKNW